MRPLLVSTDIGLTKGMTYIPILRSTGVSDEQKTNIKIRPFIC